MKVTVLWEDQLGERPKNFGPQNLLIACVRDRFPNVREQQVHSHPCKGNGNVLRELKMNLEKLSNHGPVIAVFDRDKAHELCSLPASTCRTETARGLRKLAQGDRKLAQGEYDLVFLEQNMESLLDAVSKVLGRPIPEQKLRPWERDGLLNHAVWNAGSDDRAKIQIECSSFGRLVRTVTKHLQR